MSYFYPKLFKEARKLKGLKVAHVFELRDSLRFSTIYILMDDGEKILSLSEDECIPFEIFTNKPYWEALREHG